MPRQADQPFQTLDVPMDREVFDAARPIFDEFLTAKFAFNYMHKPEGNFIRIHHYGPVDAQSRSSRRFEVPLKKEAFEGARPVLDQLVKEQLIASFDYNADESKVRVEHYGSTYTVPQPGDVPRA